MKWTQATKSNLPAEGVKIPLMMGGEYKIGFLRKDIMSFSINGDLFPYSKIKYLDESEPSPVEDVQSNDMTAREFFDSPESPITLDKICSPVEKEFLLDTIEMYAKGRVHQALNGQQTDVSGSYIRIEIVDYFGTKKVLEVKPYFDKQQLTEIEFLNAIRLLEDEKNKATYAFG